MDNRSLSTFRRSSRVPTSLPILVTALNDVHFSEVCNTLVVNAHGCAIQTRVKLDKGVPLKFHSKEGRETTAHVVSCEAIGPNRNSWKLGAKLDQPQNFWDLKDCPKDWVYPATPPARKLPEGAALSSETPAKVVPPPEAVLDRLARQLEGHVQRVVAESLRPLQAEVAALKEQIAQQVTQRPANPSRFEVSLGGIPPELQQQVEQRLRTELGPKVIAEARQQANHLLAAAKATIHQTTAEGYAAFLQRAEEELKAVEKRAEEISAHISASAREHLSHGLDDFHQHLLDGGNSLKRLSEELSAYLQHNLQEQHDAHLSDLKRLGASVISESSRLQEQIECLDSRVTKMNESADYLESGLEQRLNQMTGSAVADARGQLENVANGILEELARRSVSQLGQQLDEATGNLKIVQKGVVASVSESLKIQAAVELQAFESAMQELAGASVERWRGKLADGLNTVAKSLGEQFCRETGRGEAS